MAQFSVNAQRFDPYKNFKFRVKWDGVCRRGEQGRRAQAHHRSGETPRRRRPEQHPQIARADRVRSDHPRARGHPRHRVREMGEQGLELRLRPRRGSVAEGFPQGHHHRRLQRGRAARASATRSFAPGSRNSRPSPISTPTPMPSPSSTSSSKRGLGAGLRGQGTKRTQSS